MLLRADGRLAGAWLTRLAALTGRMAAIGARRAGDMSWRIARDTNWRSARAVGWRCAATVARGVRGVGWRIGAGALGLALAGWLGAQALSVIEASARQDAAGQDAPPRPMVTGALRTASLSPERPDWAVIQRQGASFSLGVNEIDGQPLGFTARRDLNSPRREDLARAGSFASEKAALQVSFQRQFADGSAPFFIDISRAAADAGLSAVRTTQPTALHTKFGPVEAADVTLSDGSSTRACLAFRHVAETASLRIQGWLCGGDKRPADRQQLICLLDRAALVSAGDDRELRAHFSRAELSRQPGCHVPKHQAAGRRANWLEHDQPAPKLRRAGG